MSTLSERFVRERRDRWERLRDILLKIRRSSYGSLSEREIREFAGLYRGACGDLAQARTLRLSPDVIEYLNNVVGQAHKYLYSFQPVRSSRLKAFFTQWLPGAVVRNLNFVLAAALFFFVPYIVTFIICGSDPGKASLLVPEYLLEEMAESYKTGIFSSQHSMGMSAFASSFYIQNNVTIAFLSFATGIFGGLGTVYFLIYNGIMLGAISGYVTALGYGENFLNFVTAHSVLELGGLVVAGAAGLLLGYTIIKGSRYYKKDYLGMQKERIFFLISAAALMFTCAAFIEGTVSPRPLPYMVKLAVALLSIAFLIYYFGFLPSSSPGKKRSGNKMSMKNRAAVFFLFIFLFIFSAPSTPVHSAQPPAAKDRARLAPPGPPRVKEEHRKLLERYGLEKETEIDVRAEKEIVVDEEEAVDEEETSFFDFAESLKELSLPVIIIIVVVLAVLFYLLLRGAPRFFPPLVTGGEQDRGAPGPPGEDDGDHTGDAGYKRALALAQKGAYGKALIVFHKSSLQKLRDYHLIPPGEHLTNNEIKGLIENSRTGISTPFTHLAAAAERVAFKGEEPKPETFRALKAVYETSFLKMGGKKQRVTG